MHNAELVTKSVRLESRESERLKHASQSAGLSEAALMKRFIIEGLARHLLEEAIQAYARGEIDIGAAARHADVSVYHIMLECDRRNISPAAADEKLLSGLETLANTFQGSDALHRTLAELRTTS